MLNIASLRHEYHRKICEQILVLHKGRPNLADPENQSSITIALSISKRLSPLPIHRENNETQHPNQLFTRLTSNFLKKTLQLPQYTRSEKWLVSQDMSNFEDYEHLAHLQRILNADVELNDTGHDYLITPDIAIGKYWAFDVIKINQSQTKIPNPPLQKINVLPSKPVLHASISCKWTIRSDRAQNTRTEALNLIRNRKGSLPHIVAVTAEPLPMRIAALALGTGDLDCVYHFALPELRKAIIEVENEDQLEMLNMLVEGRRLRDISDLPFDLAI